MVGVLGGSVGCVCECVCVCVCVMCGGVICVGGGTWRHVRIYNTILKDISSTVCLILRIV